MANETHVGQFKLGNREFSVGPLTLAQLKLIGVSTSRNSASRGMDVVSAEAEWYDSTFEMITQTTGVPKSDVESITGATFKDLTEARRVILRVAGLLVETPTDEGGGQPSGDAGEQTG